MHDGGANTIHEGINLGIGWGWEGGSQKNGKGITGTGRGRRGSKVQRAVP
jgi:hypothetical protein